jgi:hypothetical protein
MQAIRDDHLSITQHLLPGLEPDQGNLVNHLQAIRDIQAGRAVIVAW